jgi:hypothetical protein
LNLPKHKLDRDFVRAALALVLACSATFAGAQELAAGTARQASSGSLKFLGYYEGVQNQTLNFNTNDSGTCASKSGTAFACGQGGTVAAKGDGGAGMVKIVYQPWERFQYYAMYGVGTYSMSVPSTTVSNVLTGDAAGQIYGAGLKASIVPDTIVTPAVSLDASISQSVYNFNSRFGDPSVGPSINERLKLMTYQFAVETSHVFNLDEQWKLEPYGGLKWTRVQTDLKDLGDGSHAGGQTDTVTPFIGLRVPVEEHEAFFAEASFVDGYHYGGGMELRFK